jgi:hypothetical protein
VRARGLNFAASAGAIGSIAVAQIWPVGIDRIGSRIYFFFMAVNLVCVPIIWILYPETKARSLEDMDILFGAKQAPEVVGEFGEADNLHVDSRTDRIGPTSGPVTGP